MYLVLTLYIIEPVDFSWRLADIHQTPQSPEIWDGYHFFIYNGNALYVYGVDLIIWLLIRLNRGVFIWSNCMSLRRVR
jgi:hypothetical protein